MNYQRIYDELMQRAHTRGVPSCYYETHHIIPRCVIENNDPSNLTTLTAREHFIAHWLLVKIYYNTPHFYKLLYAFCMMKADNNKQRRYHYPSWLYAKYKKQWKHTEETKQLLSEKHKGKALSKEHKKKLSETRKRRYAEGKIQKLYGANNPQFGKTHNEETRRKMSERQTGRKDSEKTKQKKRERMLKDNPMKGKTHTEEVRQKISDRFRGGKQSEEHIQKRTKHVQGSKHMYLPETGERYLVHQENIEEMLSRGYLFGIKPPKPPKQKKERVIEEKRWLFNPQTKERVLVKVKDVDKYLEMGYCFGMK